MNPDNDNSFPTLSDLAQRLQANGMVVVRYKDHLQIRLSLFASVQVRIVDGRLQCDPRFGAIPRDRATWVTLIGLAALVTFALLHGGITPFSVALGFIAVSSSASTAIRYQVTESCITRVQTAFMLLTQRQPSTIALPEQRRVLSEAAPEFPNRGARARTREEP